VVVIVNEADVDQAGIVTLAGTIAAALLLDRVMIAPPLGAGESRVTVPLAEVPPRTLDGLTDSVEGTGGLISNVPACAPR
jgi:hypothetical protein